MEKQIDRRRKYLIVGDTETCNTRMENDKLDMRDVLVYDFGFVVCDKQGRVYEEYSFIIKEIFFGMKDLMKSAYYTDKLPQYYEEIRNGKRKVVSLYEARKTLADVMKKYNTNIFVAHNARFDDNALKVTERYTTKSKYRYFLPFGTEVWDTMKMANDTICKQKTYRKFCEENGYLTKNGQVRKTAEILYRYITQNHDFVECHTGLEDVMIEKEILAHCFRQHKAMRKKLYA